MANGNVEISGKKAEVLHHLLISRRQGKWQIREKREKLEEGKLKRESKNGEAFSLEIK